MLLKLRNYVDLNALKQSYYTLIYLYYYKILSNDVGEKVVAIFIMSVCLLCPRSSQSPCCFQKSKVNSSECEIDELDKCEDTHTEKEAKSSTQVC